LKSIILRNIKSSLEFELTSNEDGVILLEGTRSLRVGDRAQLLDLGRCLASSLTEKIFRSGNAIGSDNAFTDGVVQVSCERMEIVLPYKTHRLTAIPKNAKLLCLDELYNYELDEIKKVSIKANPDRAQLVKLYSPGNNGILSIKASYLLRDVLKLTGLMSKNFQIASAAIFHTHPGKITGGTFHTMKVCKYLGIPYCTTGEFFNS